MIEFPKDFLWGAATSSHQVEGNNVNNDWWEWERQHPQKDPSGAACKHYELYREDFDSAAALGHNAHRFSVEWSRIEPRQGEFSEEGLRHYADVIAALKSRGLEPVVTLHHFTNPLWFARLGGWEHKRAPEIFLRFVDTVVRRFAGSVRYWVTINEPDVYVYYSYIIGDWPPEKKSLSIARAAAKTLTGTHIQAHALIHSVYRQLNTGPVGVSIAKNMPAFVSCTRSLRDRFATRLRERIFNLDILDTLSVRDALDFIGINYYSRHLVHTKGFWPRNILEDVCTYNHHPLPKNSMGWDIYPEGLYALLMQLKRYGVPLMILENGICTADDNQRWDFIAQHLRMVHRALEDGAKVTGYFYWSLLDNFEWDKGFAPRFGLIDVDYATQKRTPRPSAYKFAQVCTTGRID
jgi:beta-glucosidase